MKLKNVLAELGLKPKEAEVYLSVLELGSASAYVIAKKAGLARSSCYEILEKLRVQGLISLFHKKKTKHYSAEDPERVMDRFGEKMETFKAALPEFDALYGESRHRPAVRFYSGVAGMKIIFEEVLAEADEILAFGSTDDVLKSMGPYWDKYVRKRIQKKIAIKNILFDTPRAWERKKLGVSQLREVRIIPTEFAHHGTVLVWGNKIAMFSFDKEMVALVVESKILAQTQRMMLKYMWEKTEK